MKRVFLYSALWLMLVCGVSSADFTVPQQKIEVVGGEPIPLGELCILKASDFEKTENLYAVEYQWNIYELGVYDAKQKVRVRVVDGEIWFGAGVQSKKVLAQCAATYLFVVKDNVGTIQKVAAKTALMSKIIQLGLPKPTLAGKADCAAIQEDGRCSIELTLSSAHTKPVDITLASVGTAIIDKDFKANLNVSIPPGQTSARVLIDGIDNKVHEKNARQISLSVVSVTEANFDPMQFDIVLLDNDPDVPPPPPDLPDGKFKLAKTVYKTVTDTVAVNPAPGATILANNFRGLSAKIAAGTVKSIEDLLKETNSVNTASLGSEAANWQGFADKFQDILYDMYKARTLNTLSDYQQAWIEIATGLEAVANAKGS